VPLDVAGGRAEHLGVVLELPEPTVAAEAQQCPDGPGSVVVVDMRRGLNRQMAQDPPCSSSMASASLAVIP
jgi:hypothetical protein